MTYHIILNPKASSGANLRYQRKLSSYFEKLGASCQIHETTYPGHAKQIARELSENGETEIVACGGDGTVHEVLNGLVLSDKLHLGIIPSGTGNDFCSFLHIPKNRKKAVSLIVNGTPKETDFIECGSLRCLNSMGTGIDVDVLERCRLSKLKGKIRYWKSLAVSLFHFSGNEFIVRVNGEEKEYSSFLAVLCNGGYFGGNIPICPSADVADHKLELILVRFVKGLSLVKALLALVSGKILSFPETTVYSVTEAQIIPKGAFTLQLDGELYDNLSFQANVASGLMLYRP
ncbi:MAG: diacylglycerol/lipid kinase family protein [Christensenellaceae bacterium]